MQKMDRRIKRTRKLLNNALEELIAEKPYDEITVQEIAERADVGHRTFYRRYADKDALLVDVMGNALSEFQELLVIPSSFLQTTDDPVSTAQENGRRLFEYVHKHERLFRVLFQARPIVNQAILDLARQNTIHKLRELVNEAESPIPFPIVANHLIASIVAMIRFWLDAEQPYSAEEMGKYLGRMVFRPVRLLLSEG